MDKEFTERYDAYAFDWDAPLQGAYLMIAVLPMLGAAFKVLGF